MIKAIDLFCGAGGLTYGLAKSGIKVVAGYDIDGNCRYAYEKNNSSLFIQKSVSDVTADELLQLYGNASIKVLAGCAPCQPFSSYNQKKKEDIKKDQRWSLLNSFAHHIKTIQPDIVTMENVQGLIKQNIFKDFIDNLKSLKYYVSYKVVFCPNYGLPQSRTRLVLLASKLGEIALLPETHSKENYVTLKDAIGRLPPIKAGENDPNDRLHISSHLSALNMKRIRASKPGGTWRDWPHDLVAECHKKSSGDSYASVYGRMSWDKVASTVTTQCIGYGNGRFGHPEQDRAISLREAAILQTFPKNYDFWPSTIKLQINPIARMIGNAVPVKLGEVIGKSIIQHIKRHS